MNWEEKKEKQEHCFKVLRSIEKMETLAQIAETAGGVL